MIKINFRNILEKNGLGEQRKMLVGMKHDSKPIGMLRGDDIETGLRNER